MDHIRAVLGGFCHHAGAECSELHLKRDESGICAQLAGCCRDLDTGILVFGVVSARRDGVADGVGYCVFSGKTYRCGVPDLSRCSRLGRGVATRSADVSTKGARLLAGFGNCGHQSQKCAGYLAAFSLFVQPDVPIGQQMWVIVPTALTLTACSYLTFTALGAGLGRAALGAVFNVWFRRVMAVCFVIYGVLLGASQPMGRV
jgi:hypothetical protein